MGRNWRMKGSAVLDPVVREGLSGELALEQRPSEIWGREETGFGSVLKQEPTDASEKGKDIGGAWHTVTEHKSGRKRAWQIVGSSVAWEGVLV